MAQTFQCTVCHGPFLSEPPRSEYGGGSFEICPSCGFQFGVNDDDEGIPYEEWRKKWIAGGMQWMSGGRSKPASWDPAAIWAKNAAPAAKSAPKPAKVADVASVSSAAKTTKPEKPAKPAKAAKTAKPAKAKKE